MPNSIRRKKKRTRPISLTEEGNEFFDWVKREGGNFSVIAEDALRESDEWKIFEKEMQDEKDKK